MMRIAVDANVLANWILYDAYLSSERPRRVAETERNKTFILAYQLVERILASPACTLILTPLIWSETVQVILRERILIKAYAEGVPLRRICRGVFREKRYENTFSSAEKKELHSFLADYLSRIEERGGMLVQPVISPEDMQYFIIEHNFETHDAYIFATLLTLIDKTFFVTDDQALQTRMKRFLKKHREDHLLHDVLSSEEALTRIKQEECGERIQK